MARNLTWAVGLVWRFLMWVRRRKEPPIFGVMWRFYDSEPAAGNAVGTAVFQRTWGSAVRGRWVRTRERNTMRDTRRGYEGKGFLRDRKLVLKWVAEDRPDTFGVLFVTADEDCREMEGFTVYAPLDTGKTVALSIWFKHI